MIDLPAYQKWVAGHSNTKEESYYGPSNARCPKCHATMDPYYSFWRGPLSKDWPETHYMPMGLIGLSGPTHWCCATTAKGICRKCGRIATLHVRKPKKGERHCSLKRVSVR